MKKPEVTVLMPVYNGEPYLKAAIESVLAQTYRDFELLIINDASTDASAQTIAGFSDPRIRLLANPKNLNLIGTLNRGLNEAAGRYIARMDQDDISEPERLEAQVAFFKSNPGHVLLGTEAQIISPADAFVGYEPAYLDDATLRLALTAGNAFVHGSVMFKKETALEIGGYNPEAYLMEDYNLWLRLSKAGKVANLPRPLYRWRVTPTGMSSSNAGKQKAAADRLAAQAWDDFPEAERTVPAAALPSDHRALRVRKTAQLDIQLARGYAKRGQRAKAVSHVVAALKRCPRFFLFYFYLLLAVLPSSWFFGLEARGLDRLRNSRGY